MRLTVLGKSPAWQDAGGACSGYLLEEGETAVRAALAAERVNAFGEEQALFERALGLWDRVPDPEAAAGMDQVELLKRHRGRQDRCTGGRE